MFRPFLSTPSRPKTARVLAAIALLLVLAPAAALARSVEEVLPGRKLWAEIERSEELTVVLRVVDGTELDVSVKAWKGSDLLPLLTLRDEDGQSVPLLEHFKGSKKGNKASIKRLPLAAGAYQLSVEGDRGSSGGFDLVTKAHYPKRVKAETQVATAGVAAVIPFDALPGDLAQLKVKASKKSGLSPLIERLVEEDGTETTVGEPKKSPKLPIAGAGKHRFEVSGVDGSTGEFKYVLKLKLAKASKEKLDARALNARGSISGTIVLEGDATRDASAGKLAATTTSSASDVRAGEIIVAARPGVSLESVMSLLDEEVPGIGFGVAAAQSDAGPWLLQVPSLAQGSPTLRRRRQTLTLTEAFARVPAVDFVEANRVVRAARTPNDLRYSEQYDLRQMNLPKAWDLETGSASVVIAVVDTGIWSHPDLDSKALPGYDFVLDAGNARDGNGIDNDPTDSARDFHGTHVAGTAAAATSNAVGISGVAWNCSFLPVRVLGADGGTWFDVAAGLRWAAGISVSGVPDNPNPADVVNMSLSGAYASPVLQLAVQEATSRGVVLVAAAGNSGSATPEYPAAFADVISVYALDANFQWSSYSNWGSTIDVGAPGGDLSAGLPGILSTFVDGNLQPTYTQLQGTSMAAPHVAGVAALLRSADPSLTPAQVRGLLIDTAVDLGPTGFDVDYGYGAVDAYAAVREVAGPPAAPPTLRLWPEVLEFGRLTNDLVVRVRNEGTGTVDITGISTTTTHSGDWLAASADGSTVPVNITVSVDHDMLGDGTFAGQVIVNTSVGQATVAVRVSRLPPPQLDVVRVKILDDKGSVVAQTTTSEAQDWAYELPDVPLGTYSVVAEADLDADFQLSRIDEFEGRWPILDRPKKLDVATSELDFADIDVPLLRRDAQFQFDGVGGGLIDGALAVRAFDASTGRPIPGASVFIGDGQLAAETGTNGRAVLAGSFSGGQTVTVSAEGYVTRTRIGVDGQYQSFALEPREVGDPVRVAVHVSGLTNDSTRLVVHVGETRGEAVWNGEAQQVIEVDTPRRRPAESVSAIVYDGDDEPLLAALGSLSIPDGDEASIDLDLTVPAGGARGRVVEASLPSTTFSPSGATMETLVTVRLDRGQWVPIGWSPVVPETPTNVWWASLLDLDPPLAMRFETRAVDTQGRFAERSYVGDTETVFIERPMSLPAPGTAQSPNGGLVVSPFGIRLTIDVPAAENVVDVTILDDGGAPVWRVTADGPADFVDLPDVPTGGLEPGRTYSWFVELREVPDLVYDSHLDDDIRRGTVRHTRSAASDFELD